MSLLLLFVVLLGLGLLAAPGACALPADHHALRTFINDACLSIRGTKTDVAKAERLELTESERKIPCRLYRPSVDGTLPVLLFFHGAGFVAGNLDTHDNACRYLCAHTPCLVLAVDYRLAPEHPFPAPLDDCYAAALWAARHADDLGGDPRYMAVAGDSAGGALAAAVCLMARERMGPALRAQVLVNPALDLQGWDRDGFEDYRPFKDLYLSRPEDAASPLASPLRAEVFACLPPAFVLVSENDPLRAEGEAFVSKLVAAGVLADLYCLRKERHLGPRWAAAAPAARKALDLPCGYLRGIFSPPLRQSWAD